MELNCVRLNKLEEILKENVSAHRPGENFQKLLTLDHVDRRLYAIYLSETYHYTRHNPKNQALVACREEILDVNYIKYCFNHSMEEAGHEYLALSDLNSLGVKFREEELPPPLPETEALIGYLYRISKTGNPLARLGYSYWAESVYGHTKKGTALFKEALGLKDSQMTFLGSHSKIDAEHFEEVQVRIIKICKIKIKTRQAIEDCMLAVTDSD